MKHYRRLTIIIGILMCGTDSLHAMTWIDCVAAALGKNQSIAAAREIVYQKKTDTASAVSPVLPQSSASFNGGQGGVNAADSKATTFSMGTKQLLFDGMKFYYDIKTAKIQADAAVYQYLVTESEVRLALRKAYVRLLSAQETIDIYRKIAKRRKDNYELVKLRYEAGREHRGSLLTSQADLAKAEADLTDSIRELSLAQRQLASIIGQVQYDNISVEGKLAVADECRQKPDFEFISANSPLLLQMIGLRNAALSGATASKLAFFPSVYAYFNAGTSLTYRGATGKNWETGIQMDYPLTDGGQNFLTARKSDSEVRRTEAEMRQTKLDVLYTLEEKWSLLQRTLDQADVARQFVEASLERSKIAEAQYSIGQISFNNWTIIEDDLVNAIKTRLLARVAAMNAEAEWIQAQGGTLSNEK